MLSVGYEVPTDFVRKVKFPSCPNIVPYIFSLSSFLSHQRISVIESSLRSFPAVFSLFFALFLQLPLCLKAHEFLNWPDMVSYTDSHCWAHAMRPVALTEIAKGYSVFHLRIMHLGRL